MSTPPPPASAPPPPPSAWPPPTWPSPDPAHPRRPGRRLVVVGVVAALLVVAFVVAVAVLVGRSITGDVVDPTYRALDDDERRAVMVRAADVGADLDAWWSLELGRRGIRAVPVGARLTDGDDGVRCDGVAIEPDDDLLDNAYAVGCTEGPAVAIDPATFRGSDIALQVVLAHEWGHVVQWIAPDRLDEVVHDPDATPAEGELQADCYAGAWAATRFDADELAEAGWQLALLGDPPDVADDDPDGHGTAAEREEAFVTGVDGGVDACLPAAFDPR